MTRASYHFRFKYRTLIMSTKKHNIVAFMAGHCLMIPDPLPIKSVLLESVKDSNIQSNLVSNEIVQQHGHEVLRLSPQFCNLHAIQLVLARLKGMTRKQNVTKFQCPQEHPRGIYDNFRKKRTKHAVSTEVDYLNWKAEKWHKAVAMRYHPIRMETKVYVFRKSFVLLLKKRFMVGHQMFFCKKCINRECLFLITFEQFNVKKIIKFPMILVTC